MPSLSGVRRLPAPASRRHGVGRLHHRSDCRRARPAQARGRRFARRSCRRRVPAAAPLHAERRGCQVASGLHRTGQLHADRSAGVP